MVITCKKCEDLHILNYIVQNSFPMRTVINLVKEHIELSN